MFVTDVPGIFTFCPKANPDRSTNALIKTILINNETGLIENGDAITTTTNSESKDVTGGMLAKIESAARICRGGVDVVIVEGGTANVEDACCCVEGVEVVGTTVRVAK